MTIKACLIFMVFISSVANLPMSNYTIDFAKIPRDCIWSDWSPWAPYPDCPFCIDLHFHDKDEVIKIHRMRKVIHAGNRYGACHSHVDVNRLQSLPMSERRTDLQEKVCKSEECTISISRTTPAKDCVWKDWSEWNMECPDCRDSDYYEDGETIEKYRHRGLKDRGNSKGKCYSYKDTKKENNLQMRDRRTEDDIEECPEVPSCPELTPSWTEWGEWGDCSAECGKPAFMRRFRNCKIENDDGSVPDIEKAKDVCDNLIQFSNNERQLVGDNMGKQCPQIGTCKELKIMPDAYVNAPPGDKVELECKANSTTCFQTCLHCFFEGPSGSVSVPPFSPNNTLCTKVIKHVKAEDAGKWLCKFEMGTHIQQTTIHLTVGAETYTQRPI